MSNPNGLPPYNLNPADVPKLQRMADWENGPSMPEHDAIQDATFQAIDAGYTFEQAQERLGKNPLFTQDLYNLMKANHEFITASEQGKPLPQQPAPTQQVEDELRSFATPSQEKKAGLFNARPAKQQQVGEASVAKQQQVGQASVAKQAELRGETPWTEQLNSPEANWRGGRRNRTATEVALDTGLAVERGAHTIQKGLVAADARAISAQLEDDLKMAGMDPKEAYKTANNSYSALKNVETALAEADKLVAEADVRIQSRNDKVMEISDTIEEKTENRSDVINRETDLVQKKLADKAEANPDRGIAEEFVDTLDTLLEYPAQIGDMAAEEVPSMVAGGLAGKGVMKAANVAAKQVGKKLSKEAAENIGEALGVSTAVIEAGSANAADMYEEVLKTSTDDLALSSPEYQRLVTEEGMTPEKARQTLANKAYSQVLAQTGLVAGVASKLTGSGKFTGNLFNAEGTLGKRFNGIIGQAAKGQAAEGAQETIESAAEAVVANKATQDYVDEDQTLSEGVGTQAAYGAAAGGAIGGAAGAGKGLAHNLTQASKKTGEALTRGKVAVETRDFIKENGTKEAITDVEDPNFSMRGFAEGIKARNKVEGVTPEEIKENYKTALDKWGEMQIKKATHEIALEEAEAGSDEHKKAKAELDAVTKDMKSAASIMKRLKQDSIEAAKVPEAVEVLTSESATAEEAQEAAERVMGSIAADYTSITEEDADRLLGSSQLNDNQKKVVQNAKNLQRARKTMDQAAMGVFQGTEGFRGIDEYMTHIPTLVQSGSHAADKMLQQLAAFSAQRVQKAADLRIALETDDSAKRAELLAKYDLNQDKVSPRLVKQVEQERDAVVAANNLLQGMNQLATNQEATTDVPSTPEPTPTGTPATDSVVQPSDSAPVDLPPLDAYEDEDSRDDDEADLEPAPVVPANQPESADAEPTVPSNSEPVTETEPEVQVRRTPQEIEKELVKAEKKIADTYDKWTEDFENVELEAEYNKAQDEFDALAIEAEEINGYHLGAQLVDAQAQRDKRAAEKEIAYRRTKQGQIRDANMGREVLSSEVPPAEKRTKQEANSHFKSTNQVKENFRVNVRKGITTNPLQVVKDFATRLAQTPSVALQFLDGAESLTDKQTALLNNFSAMAIKLDAFTKKVFPEKAKYPQQDYMHYLSDEDGVFDPNVNTAIAAAIHTYLAHKAGDLEFNDPSDLNQMFGMQEENDAGRRLMEYTSTDGEVPLMYAGTMRKNVVADLGKAIVQTIGIKADKSAGRNVQGKMEMSLGSYALDVLLQQGVLVQKDFNQKDIAKITGKDSDSISDKAVLRLISVKRGAENEVHPDVTQYREMHEDTYDVLTRLFKVDPFKTGPHLKKPKSLKQRMQANTRMTVDEQVNKILNKHSQREHFVKVNQNKFFLEQISTEEGKQAFMELMGWKDPETVQQHNRKGQEGINRGIEKSLRTWEEFYGTLESDETPFYFQWEQWKNQRVGILSNTVNPQGDKIHRHLLGLGGQKQTIQMNDTDLFMVGIAQGFDIDIDKQTDAQSLAQLEEKLREPVFYEGIQQAVNLIEGKPHDMDKIMATIKAGKGKAHTMDALFAYAEYLKALRAGETEFTSDYSVEGDGVTNGPAIASIQFAVGTSDQEKKEILKRVSVGMDGDTEQFGSWIQNNNDNYQNLATMVAAEVSLLQGNDRTLIDLVIGSLLKEDGSVDKAGRNLTKNPLMTAIYGSSEDSIVEAMGYMMLGKIYDFIEDNAGDPEALKTLASALKLNQKDTALLLQEPLNFQLDTKQENQYRSIGETVFGEVTYRSIKENYASFMETRDKLNGMLKVVFELYSKQRAFLLNQKREEMIEDGLIAEQYEDLPSTVVKEIEDSLLEAMPVVHSYFSKQSGSLESGIYVAKTDKTTPKNEKGTPLNPYVSKADRSNFSKLRNTAQDTVEIREPIDGGVSPTVLMVQSTDAATMLKTLNGADVLNVHDAIFTGLANGLDDMQLINKSFSEVMSEFSILEEAHDALTRAVAQADKFEAEHSQSIKQDKELLISMVRSVDPTLNYQDAQQVLKQFSPEQIWTKYLQTMDQVTQKTLADKKQTTDRITSWGQYYMENGQYITDVKTPYEYTPEAPAAERKQAVAESKKGAQTVDEFFFMLPNRYKNKKKNIREANARIYDHAYSTKSENAEQLLAVLSKFSADLLDKPIKKAAESLTAEQRHWLNKMYLKLEQDQPLPLFSGNEFEVNDFNAEHTSEVSKENLVQTFEELGKTSRKQENTEHKDHLRNILGNLVQPFMNKVNLHLANTLDYTKGAISGSDIMLYTMLDRGLPEQSKATTLGMKMSAQEVFTHEMTHAILRKGIDGNSLAKQQLERIYHHVRSNKLVTIQDFMDNPQNPIGSEDYNRAKSAYEYIFKIKPSDRKGRSNYLQEFAAYALTNEKMIKALSQHPMPKRLVNPKVLDKSSWVNTIRNIFALVVDTVLNRVTKAKPGQGLDSTVTKLAMDIAAVEAKNKQKAIDHKNRNNGIHIDSITEPMQKVRESVLKWGQKKFTPESEWKAVRIVGNVLRWDSEKIQDFLEHTAAVKGHIDEGLQGIVSQTVTEFLGRTDSNGSIYDFALRKQKYIDQSRKEMEGNTYKFANSIFEYADLTPETRESITKAVLKTDLSILRGHYNTWEIGDMLADEKYRHQQERALLVQLRQNSGKNFGFYQRAAQALGHYMATGRVYEAHTLLNAENIAKMVGLESTPPKGWQKHVDTIDMLATLYAVRDTKKEHRDRVADVFRSDEKGMNRLLHWHNEMVKQDHQDLFDGNELNIMKGYIRDLTNPHIDVVQATERDAEELVRQGYVKTGEQLSRDKYDPESEPVYHYVNSYGAMAGFNGGIISLTDKQAKGTAVQLDPNDLRNGKRREMEEMRKTKFVDPWASKGGQLLPSLDSSGSVKSYRYVMADQTKDNLLERHNDFAEVMAKMASYSLDKVRTPKINKGAITALHDLYQEQKDGVMEDAFVEISPDSDIEGVADMWYMMPKETQEDAQRIWGRQAMFVRRDLVPMVFGQRQKSLANLTTEQSAKRGMVRQALYELAHTFGGPKTAARIMKGENILKEYVKEFKEFVIVKSGFVTVLNVVSNYFQLVFDGVNMKEAIQWQAEGYAEARKYRQWEAELFQLEKRRDLNERYDADRLAELRHKIVTSPVHRLIQDGMLQTIIEDVELTENRFAHKNAITKHVDKMVDKLPKWAAESLREGYMTHDSTVFKFMNEAAQLSDFASRYALYKHKTERAGMAHAEARGLAMEVFTNYANPTNPYVQYLNDMGLLWFTKYYFRIQKQILRNFREQPARLLMFNILNAMTGGAIPSVLDTILSPEQAGNLIRLPGTPVEMIGMTGPGQVILN